MLRPSGSIAARKVTELLSLMHICPVRPMRSGTLGTGACPISHEIFGSMDSPTGLGFLGSEDMV